MALRRSLGLGYGPYRNLFRTYSSSCSSKGSDSDKKLLDIEVNDKTGIAIATMQRAPVNSLNLELLSQLSKSLTELENNRSRGLILTSASKSVFCAGLDITEMYKPEPNRCRQFWTTLQEVWMQLYGSSFPTVAAINGHAPAGGCLLAMCCEYRIMVNNFTIGLNETKLGIVAPKWFITTMQNTIGLRQTELALTLGRLFSTDDALGIGLIDEDAMSKEEAIAKAEKFLVKFKSVNPMARAFTKVALRGKDVEELRDNREQDLELFMSLVTQDKVQKGLEIYLESLKKKK